MNRKDKELKKVFAKHITKKVHLYNEFLHINHKNAENPIQKGARDLHRHITKENIQIANKYIKKMLNVISHQETGK